MPGRIFCLALLALLPVLASAAKEASKAVCPYPHRPLDWISHHCAMTVENIDPAVIRASPCYKAAAADLKSKDVCAINEKYKRKTCEFLIKNGFNEEYQSLNECLEDKSLLPFFNEDS
jgi:hypothetical protein